MAFTKGHKTNVGRQVSEETRRKIGLANKGRRYGHLPQSFKKGHIPWIAGVGHSEESKAKMSAIALLKGRKPPKQYFEHLVKVCNTCKNNFQVIMSQDWRKHCSNKCYALSQLGKVPWNKGKHVPQMMGANHPRWKGGNKSFKRSLPSTIEWRQWRKEVFERDGYRCMDCGEKGYIEPHHVIPLKQTLSRAFDINNGITLCRPCHKKTMGKELELANNYFALIPVRV